MLPRFLIVLLVFGLSQVSPCQQSTASKSAVKPPARALFIAPGDLLKIIILGAPDADQEVRVGADGNAGLSFIGSVRLAGLSIDQAQTIIANKLNAGGFYADP